MENLSAFAEMVDELEGRPSVGTVGLTRFQSIPERAHAGTRDPRFFVDLLLWTGDFEFEAEKFTVGD